MELEQQDEERNIARVWQWGQDRYRWGKDRSYGAIIGPITAYSSCACWFWSWLGSSHGEELVTSTFSIIDEDVN